MPGLIAANALVLLRRTVSIPITAGVLVSVGWIHALTGAWQWNSQLIDHDGLLAVLNVFFQVEWSVTGVLAAYGMIRLGMLVVDLRETRRELADIAVHEERWRLARDVHDLLGLGLSAITLKAELASKLTTTDPSRATTELVEISALSHHALGDVRSVADGDRELRLDAELTSARDVLASARIDVQIVTSDVDSPDPQSGALAAAIREGATNVLRHSRAQRCRITLARTADSVDLEIANDGVLTDQPGDQRGGGSGLRSLTHRLSRVGGRLTSGVAPDGSYHLYASVPLTDRR